MFGRRERSAPQGKDVQKKQLSRKESHKISNVPDDIIPRIIFSGIVKRGPQKRERLIQLPVRSPQEVSRISHSPLGEVSNSQEDGLVSLGENRSFAEYRISGFNYPEKGTPEEKNAWYFFNEILSKHEVYAPESNVTQYVQDRLNGITNGEKAKVIVVHDDALNAIALPGYVLVNDGILKIIEYQEELDGLLAHEWIHHERGHISHTTEEGSVMGAIGRRRINETEADILAIERLDQRGINPLGLLSLLEKMEAAHTVEQELIKAEAKEKNVWKKEEKQEIIVGDITHGSLLDRRLNLEEILWLADIRNLSSHFTPPALDTSDFQTYQKDEELWERYDQLDTLTKSHLIQRQFRKAIINKADDRSIFTLDRLFTLQKNLFQEVDPRLADKTLADLVALSTLGRIIPLVASSDGFEIKKEYGIKIEDVIPSHTTREDMQDLHNAFFHPLFEEMGIVFDLKARDSILKKVLNEYVQAQKNLDVEGYRSVITSFGSLIKTPENFTIFLEPLFAYLERKGTYEASEGKAINTLIAELEIPIYQLEGYMRYKSPKFHEKRLNFFLELVNKKIEKLNEIEDPIAFFQYITPYGAIRGGTTDSSLHIEVDALRETANKFIERIPIKEMIDLLNVYQKDHSYSSQDKEWLNSIVTAYQIYFEEQEERASKSKKGLGETKIRGNIRDRLLLYAIGGEKKEYLNQLGGEIGKFTSQFGDLQSLETLANLILTAPQQAKEMGFPIDWEISSNDLKTIEGFSGMVLKRFLREVSRKDTANLITMLDTCEVGTLSFGKFSNAKEYNVVTKQWEEILNNLIGKKEHTQQDILELFALGYIAENLQINLQVPQAALKKWVENASFEEATHLVFERFTHLPSYLFSQAVEYLIEKKASTLEELAYLEDKLKSHMDIFLPKDEVIGQIAFADGLLIDNYANVKPTERKVGIQQDEIKGMEPARLLNALLTTSIDDKELKTYLFERWWLRYRTIIQKDLTKDEAQEMIDLRGHFQIEDLLLWGYPGKEARLRFWANSYPERNMYKPLTQVLSDTYLATTPLKYYALRKILTGENGVLTNEADRQEMINAFFNGWVDFSNAAESKAVMQELLTSLFAVADKTEVYQRINPVLLDMLLKIPEQTYSYESLAKDIATQKWEQIKEKTTRQALIGRGEFLIDHLTRKLSLLMTGGQKNVGPLDKEDNASKLLDLFADTEKPGNKRQLSPLELAILVGKKAGAVGVRSLQLAGQYFDIPPEELDTFTQVYDSMKGQTRLQAYRTLKREAHFSPEIADLLANMKEFQPRIGGGSLMTVYKAIMKDKSAEAISIKNPNVEYHMNKVIDTLQKTVAHARTQNPANKEYQLFQVLLADVKQWITDELEDPRFEEKDKAFREQNDSRYGQFDTSNNRYNILIPQSIPTGTRWVRREEFIEGKNLTSLQVSNERTNIPEGIINKKDYKEAVSLLVRNYIYQLTQTGLVHSDVHPGNFRITSDNTSIAQFDRYNLIELDKNEKNFIQSLIPAIAIGGVEQAVRLTGEYLFSKEENVHLGKIKNDLIEQVTLSGNGDLEESIMNAIVMLKQKGVHVPLKISLIAKNLFALNSFAKSADFQGIVDALLSKEER